MSEVQEEDGLAIVGVRRIARRVYYFVESTVANDANS